MATVKLAQALLRRKELQAKVNQLSGINRSEMFEPVVRRVSVTQSLDDLTAQVPKLEAAQVTREYDMYASALRQVDAAIQQKNWTADVDLPDEVMLNYAERFPVEPVAKATKPATRVRRKVASREA